MWRVALVLSLFVLVLANSLADDSATEAKHQFFEKKIRPLLIEKCYACHSTEKNKSKGDLKLDTEEAWLRGGEQGPAVVPGKPEESLLIKAVRYEDDNLKMPPKSHGGKLSDVQIRDMEQWIKDGAKAPVVKLSQGDSRQWWSFQPVQRPLVPGQPATLPIDAFINSKLAEKGLTPLKPADKRTLLRRVTYDLTGLPPTTREMNDFLDDTTPQAFSKIVDRLLASPQYGVKWGRHWLDLVRYADAHDERSYDKEGDFLDAWRYRDWVVNAFNRDMPYDQFIIHQLAGDILAEQPGAWSEDKIIATGVYAIGSWGNGDADKEKIHTDIVDDQIDVTSRVFMGLTIACARCHDHKFDPITTHDYYGLAGFFFSSHILDKFAAKGDGERIMRTPLLSPDDRKKMADTQARLEGIDKKLNQTLRPVDAFYPDVIAKGVHAWSPKGAMHPSVVINSKDEPTEFGGIKMKARSIALHPSPTVPAVLLWKSPIEGKITIKTQLKDVDPNCGDGIGWQLSHDALKLHAGQIGNGGFATLPDTTVTVKKGEQIHLSIKSPGGDHTCDTTEVTFTITGEAGQSWDVSKALSNGAKQGENDLWWFCGGNGSRLTGSSDGDAKLIVDRAAYAKSIADRTFAQALLEGGIPGTAYAGFHDARIHKRGSYNRLGEVVPRAYPAMLTSTQPHIKQGSGRLELARWIASPSHPLTARVMVNRLWQHHFGQGLVRTPNNFGKLGTLPTHPELLDYLASEFIQSGWSLKAMHRLILNSQVYQRASLIDGEQEKLLQLDPDNLYLARQHRRRLNAEELRDTLLTVTEQMDKTLGGKAIRDINSKRRTLYITCIRSDRTTYQMLFDVADPTAIIDQRTEATVAPQALWLLNHPFVADRAKRLSELVVKQPSANDARMHWLAQRLYQRDATSNELSLSRKIIPDASKAADWEKLCQVLLCANELYYLD
jgi:hypothetical protein